MSVQSQIEKIDPGVPPPDFQIIYLSFIIIFDTWVTLDTRNNQQTRLSNNK